MISTIIEEIEEPCKNVVLEYKFEELKRSLKKHEMTIKDYVELKKANSLNSIYDELYAIRKKMEAN